MPAARGAEGVFASAITPRRQGLEEVDLGALWELLDFLSAARIDGITLPGAAAEFVHFTMDERIRMSGLAVRRSRVPVLINVSHSALDCALQLGAAAVRSAAAGLLLSPPPLCRYDQSDLIAFYSVFHEHFGDRVPLYLSNLPACCPALEPDTAVHLLNAGYAGVDDASGDWSWFASVHERAPGKQFLIGSDALFARARKAGAAGVTSAAACAVPELVVALDRAILSGQAETAATHAARLDEFVARSAAFPAPLAIREAVAVRGLKTGQPAAPVDARKARQLAEFREWFKGWLPQVQKEVRLGAAHA